MKCVYSAPGHEVDATDFIYGTYMHIHLSYMAIRYIDYMYRLMDKFVSGTCMPVTYEVDVVVGCWIYMQI